LRVRLFEKIGVRTWRRACVEMVRLPLQIEKEFSAAHSVLNHGVRLECGHAEDALLVDECYVEYFFFVFELFIAYNQPSTLAAIADS
jgi:hypothetical protein